MRTPRPLLLFVALVSSPFPAVAEKLTYTVTARTGDGYWDGTWMPPKIRLFGEKGEMTWRELSGDFSRPGSEASTRYTIEDIGVIVGIQLMLGFRPAADASPGWVCDTVVVETPHDVGSAERTRSLFVIGEELHGNVISKEAVRITGRPTLSVTPEGAPVHAEEMVTKVHFYSNLGGAAEETANQVTETWSDLTSVAVSKSLEQGTTTELALAYQYDTRVAGTLSTELRNAWSQAMQTAQESVEEKGYSLTQDWSYTVAPHTDKFRKVIFSVPRDYVMYVTTDRQERRVMRKPAGKITAAAHVGQTLEIPTTDRNDDIVPVAWHEIESNWMRHLDDTARQVVMQQKAIWLQRGYVFEGHAPPAGAARAGEPPTVAPDGQQPAILPVGAEVWILSMSRPDHHVLASGDAARLRPGAGGGAIEDDSTFIVRPGLSGEGVSLESARHPGRYLRHAYFGVKLSPGHELADRAARDASFRARPALNRRAGGFSLEAVNFPRHFLRDQGLVVRLEEDDRSPRFADDASFLARRPDEAGPTVTSSVARPEPPRTAVTPWHDATLAGAHRLQVVGNGRHLHLNGLGDRLVSTRFVANDDWVVFDLEPQADGSYRIRSRIGARYLHVNGMGDKLVSTRWDADDDYTRFYFERQPDGTHRIRVKTGGYLHLAGGGDGDHLLSTRWEAGPDDAFTRFRVVSVAATF
jgi:hypothetical protein